ncbi:restriction endonuclease [Antrihabitans cavernicola]|uniref:Restriction endonuclease n=1 Tax=Antrihabitans cavernicola TaxID=2495913 RepID=A0A5A7SFN0_9NOCA|nr:restriction endonuclease [Spelaeibacter cavernicola]KAA0023325.1 restriction endonuclease [Spelaeibacter cavernicola]
MARQQSYSAAVAQAKRETARAQAAQLRVQAAQRRAQIADDRDRKRLYVDSRLAEVEAMNFDLDTTVQALQQLLQDTLNVDDYLDFAKLKQPLAMPNWNYEHLENPTPTPSPEHFTPPPLTGMAKMFGKAKYELACESGRLAYEEAIDARTHAEHVRLTELHHQQLAHKAAYVAAQKKMAEQHSEVDAFESAFTAGEPAAVVGYFDLVLQASNYPVGFDRIYRLAYVPESRQIVIEYNLPAATIVPAAKAHKYVKTNDNITQTARPAAQIKSPYAPVIAQVTLRTLHELFEADRGRHLDVVVFNGVLHTVNPSTGQHITPCLISVRSTRETFNELNLSQVDPLACLKHLSAGVSKSPAELVPVRPVLEFDMVDPRFVAESDALSIVDQRPNLMELSPNEFEVLIQNLFSKMGLESRQTQASRDGGVDCVAYDPRPIFGGKVVIQAKRYKNTVGVSAVRDLYGTLQNEGASKGILVTTSGYGQASFTFAENKPIELLDGANLLYLLREHTGLEAKIEPPDDWKDPVGDPPTTPSDARA